jgi:hypothetical protein
MPQANDDRARESSIVQRRFAGILGTAAFTTSVLYGWSAGGDAAAVLPRAAACLALFAVIGTISGSLALWMVEEGVTAQLREALAERGKKDG